MSYIAYYAVNVIIAVYNSWEINGWHYAITAFITYVTAVLSTQPGWVSTKPQSL